LSDVIAHLLDRRTQFSALNTQSKIQNTDLDAMEDQLIDWRVQLHDLIIELCGLTARLEWLNNKFAYNISTQDTEFRDLRIDIAAWKTKSTALTTKVTALNSDITKRLLVQGEESTFVLDVQHPLTIDSESQTFIATELN
jgi:predicted  nucleic acid-binding Zn-ribbon protein